MKPSTIKLSPSLVDANTQTAKCGFNVKFKTANYIPLCHSGPYHTFIFHLHFGSNPLPRPHRRIICDSICNDARLTQSRESWLAAAWGLQPLLSRMADTWFIWGKVAQCHYRALNSHRKLCCFRKWHAKITAKNNAWSQLSVVVSMMGMLRPPLPTSTWFLSFCSSVHMQAGGTRTGSFSGLLAASVLLWQACHLFSYHTFSNLSCPEKAGLLHPG